MKHEDKIIKGKMDKYYEQGMPSPVGIVYSRANNKICWLDDGDLLTIFNKNSKKREIIWEGVLTFPPSRLDKIPAPNNIERDDWVKFLLEEYPAEVLPAKYVSEYLEAKNQDTAEKKKKDLEENKLKTICKLRAFRKYIKTR